VRFLSRRLALVVVMAVVAATSCAGQTVKVGVGPFYPAYLAQGTPPTLLLFPPHGPELKVDLPTGLNANFRVIGSSPDGKAIYFQKAFSPEAGITRVEFNPARSIIVPGSVGIGTISSFIESAQTGRIFVSARTPDGMLQCGDFEIDPNEGVFRELQVGASPDCGGSVSPDGKRDLRIKRELHAPSGQLILRELATGTEKVVGKGYSTAAWSPDGRQIAAILESKSIVLMDTNSPSKKRKLGSGDGPLIWSPDSKWLALPKSEFSCLLTLYFESLQVLDVETGKRRKVPSSHCELINYGVAWVASDAFRQ
jgi:hypothetical protein